MRQGCPLSSLLFNLLMADLEEMGKMRWGGVMIEEERVYMLADDLVILVENEGEMKSMMERLEEYLDRKRLMLNKGKTKIMRFRKKEERISRVEWRWKE